MTTSTNLRRVALAGALVTVLFAAGCQTPAPEPAAPPAPPPPPPPPTLSLSAVVTDAAATYLAYMREASAITPVFTDGASVQTSLRRGAAFESEALSRGAVAYAAVVALQDQTFVTAVRQMGTDPAARTELIHRLFSDPAYAAALPGADSAAGLAVAALHADGAGVHNAGKAVKQAAYDVQRQRWSREHIRDQAGRLAGIKALAAQSMPGSPDESARLLQAAYTGSGLPVAPAAAQAPYTETINRGLALAALAVLGAAGDEHAEQIGTLLQEQNGVYCLNMSKMNLNQCLAVAKPHYEDVFCLGQHVLMDAGQCVLKAAGGLQLPAALPVSITVAQPAAADAAGASAQAVSTSQPQ